MAQGQLETFDYYSFNAGVGLYNNSTDSFKYAFLSDTFVSIDKSVANPTLSDFTEVTAGGNYNAGGNDLTGTTWSYGTVAAGVTSLDFGNVTLARDAANPTSVRTMLIINETAGDRAYHYADLTTDGTTAIDIVNNDLSINVNVNGTLNITVI